MASKNIKGISIEIDGNTTGLQKALKSVDSTSVKLNGELKEVNKLLKFDPSNATLLAQKQQLLTDSIENTSTKLNQLKSAQSQVEAQFKAGNIGEEQYRAFQRELTQTEQSLNSYKSQLSNLQAEQQKLGQNTDRLNTYFSASGKSLDDFADILGTRLVNAIKNGTATSDQLEVALNKIGKEALGADTDISKFKSTLDSVQSGNSLDNIQSELQEISPKAKDAENSLDSMADAITDGNMMQAGEVISSVGDKVLDLANKAKDTALAFDSSFGAIVANTNLSKAEMENLEGVATKVFKSGVTDSIDEATQATMQMKSTFSELNDEDLEKLTSQVISLSNRTGTDYNENIKAANYLTKAFGVSNQTAFDMVASGYQNGLNASDDFTDSIVEYSGTVAEAGYTNEEFFSMLETGLKNGVRNTDLIADSMVEFSKKLAAGDYDDMIAGMSDGTQELFDKYKKGEATVAEVMTSVQGDIKKMSPAEQQKALTKLGSQFEDIGVKAFLGLNSATGEFENVGGAMDKAAKKDPSQKWQASWNEFSASLQQIGTDVLTALQPIMNVFADLSEGFGKLPEPLRIIIEVIGGVIAVLTLLAPFISSLMTVIPALGGAFTALGGFIMSTAVPAIGGLITAIIPFLPIIAGVALAIGAVILVVKNWGAITDWVSDKWSAFKDFIGNLWDGIKQNASSIWNGITSSISNAVNSVLNTVSNVWNGIKNTTSNIWNGIKSTISGVWDGIKNTTSNVVNGVKNTVSNVFNGLKSTVTGIWNGIKSAITNPIESAKNTVSNIINTIKGLFNFSLKFPSISIPHIPLPHFSLSGSFNPLKGQIPKIGIDWYANGGILTKPTIFGQNGNSLMVGGEAGKEAVAPLSDLMAYVEKAVANQMGSMSSNFAQMIQLLTIIASKDMNLNMDGKAVTAIVDSYMSNQQQQNDFGIGRV